jgi:predicted dehydrogenase
MPPELDRETEAMNERMNRRAFLRRGACGAAGVVVLGGAASATSYAANDKLNLALVGVGGRGSWFVGCIPRMGQNMVAMCDVNDQRAKGGFQALPKARKFRDFRKMLDEMGKGIDAVIVATPDHNHATATAAAMRAGKGVYCEKPLTPGVWEARDIRRIATECKVATQMGNQGTASGQFREAVDVIRAGRIGTVGEVNVWNSAGGRKERPRPTGKYDVPAWLDWDLWLGPVSQRPYHPHWMWWHNWRDFGSGTTGNWATHSANLAFMALKVDSLWYADASTKPRIKVQATASRMDRLGFPEWESVRYDIPARGDLGPLRLNWYNGKNIPGSRAKIEKLIGRGLDWGDKGAKAWKDHGGAAIVGTEGVIHATEHNATYTIVPAEKFKGAAPPPRKMPRSRGHEREWFDAVRGGPKAMSNFDYAGPLIELLMLGNVATQIEGPIEFDPLACKITNNPEADALLRREYRKGWTL